MKKWQSSKPVLPDSKEQSLFSSHCHTVTLSHTLYFPPRLSPPVAAASQAEPLATLLTTEPNSPACKGRWVLQTEPDFKFEVSDFEERLLLLTWHS